MNLEIARLAFSKNTHVNGGASRLLKYAKKIAQDNGAKRLISYADNRLGQSFYDKFMEFKKLTVPRFWWTDFDARYDRFAFKADKIRGLTEAEVASQAGVSKIYGCSNSLYEIIV